MTPLLLAGAVWVTGYTCDVPRGQPYCGTTADGTQVAVGVAACPPSWPFGTHLRIEGVGDVWCHDRGPANAVDVWLPTIDQCYAVTGYRAYVVVGEDQR